MGYETGAMRTGLLMAFRDEDPAGLPGPPRGPKAGEVVPPSGIVGSTLNHYKISLFVRALYLLRTRSNPPLLAVTLAALVAQYRHELAVAWECRGQQCEQTSPSHGQQHEGPAWGTLWMALRYGLTDLAAVTLAWVRASLTVSDIFAPAVQWRNPDGKLAPVPALLVVGMRAHGGDQPVDGRCYVRDALHQWARNGEGLPIGDDPLIEVDEAALHYARRIEREYLPKLRELLNAEPREIPPLRFPVEVHRGFGEDRAYRLQCPEPAGVQHLAGIREGEIFFGFTPGIALTSGHGWRLARVVRGAPIAEYPAVGEVSAGKAVRIPALADLPPDLGKLVESGTLSLEQATRRALRNRPSFAQRWPDAATALRQKGDT